MKEKEVHSIVLTESKEKLLAEAMDGRISWHEYSERSARMMMVLGEGGELDIRLGPGAMFTNGAPIVISMGDVQLRGAIHRSIFIEGKTDREDVLTMGIRIEEIKKV